MVAIFVQCTKTLSVHDQDLNRIALRRETLDWLAPDPDSLLDK
jgi:hypothetical protein